MPSTVGTVIVMALYGLCLFVIWYVSPRLPGAEHMPSASFWRNPRVWASFVALAQMATYAWLS